VPRYVLLGQPGYEIDILGHPWQYFNDSWGDTYATITYEDPTRGGTQLTQGFAILEEGGTAEDLFGPLPPEGYTLLETNNDLDQVGDFVLVGVVKEELGPSFFAVLETEKYVYSVEITFPEKTTLSLQQFYDSEVADIFEYVLQATLEKSKVASPPTPTPMSPDQQHLYDLIGGWLVTVEEANGFYAGTYNMFGDKLDGVWEPVGDYVNDVQGTVCRSFVDRTNDDVPLVAFSNCIIYVGSDFEIQGLADYYSTAVSLESNYDYTNDFVVYGYGNGHTYFEAFLLNDEFLFQVVLESRTFTGQTTEDVFNAFNDEFIYNVLLTNLERRE